MTDDFLAAPRHLQARLSMFAVHRRFDKLFRASETSYQSYAALACGFWFLTALACPSPFVDLLGRDGTGSRYCGEDAKASPSQSSLEKA